MSLRDDCIDCTHAKETHASDVESSGDATQERRIVYGACLAAWCACRRYEPPDGPQG